MKTVLVAMVGISFTLGVVFGLLLQLPSETSLPADPLHPVHDSHLGFRSRRSLTDGDESTKTNGFIVSTSSSIIQNKEELVQPAIQPPVLGVNNVGRRAGSPKPIKGNGIREVVRSRNEFKSSLIVDNPIIGSSKELAKANNRRNDLPREVINRSVKEIKGLDGSSWESARSTETKTYHNFDNKKHADLLFEKEDKRGSSVSRAIIKPGTNRALRMTINLRKDRPPRVLSNNKNYPEYQGIDRIPSNTNSTLQEISQEDLMYLSKLIKGVTWGPQLESLCPRPFPQSEVDQWRSKADSLDIVKIEEGCGRMQNRLLTFRDASKACARYRLNTDQIQGEVFSYYLARLLNITNIPPTLLVKINALSSKWSTVNIDMSFAQWADKKLIVLTKFIPGLSPAHIPGVFRDQKHRLEPTLTHLGGKTHPELCELVQWSDLIILDYLTANLDRVINNMFNRQWNDQMMNNPAHNLDKFKDGRLVFLDNESGLFHGYRLLDKYSRYHTTMLKSLCIFRPSTVQAVKRLHFSRSIGSELHNIFTQNEVFHEFLAEMPEKNVKMLQQRLNDVYEQIVNCERDFHRYYLLGTL